MLETCLNNKTIRDFLNNYETSRWKQLVPSLIEIAILNLNSSFNTVIFSEEDIKNIIAELKTSQNSKNTQSQKPKRDTDSHIIFSKPSNQWRTADGGVPPISGNKEKEFYFDNSSLTNTSKYNKDNKEIARENMMNKKIIKNTKSKIKEQVENDKRNYYNKVNGNNVNNINKPIEKINYAISYDKNLEPELIEKTTINNNKKGGKKIVEKMTQEEYEQKFPDEEKNIENEYEEEEDDDNNEQNYEENEEEEYYEAPNQNFNNIQYNNNIQSNNNQNKDRKNLYHYKTDYNQNNKNVSNKMNQENKTYNNNQDFMQNPQQSFNPKSFKNNIPQNINKGKNNYINIENNANEPQNNEYNYNPNPSEQYNNNYKIGMSESDDKSSKFIGIEQKYQKKIDELEKNIINTGDNYGDKLKVNITNMEDYNKNNNQYQNYQYNNMNNNEEEMNENEENNLSDMDMNQVDGGVLSQMSNMSERTKDLFKRTMDEYPPLDEDTF